MPLSSHWCAFLWDIRETFRLESITLDLVQTSVQGFRGGLVFKTHRRWYHSTPGLSVEKKKKRSDLHQNRLDGPFLDIPLQCVMIAPTPSIEDAWCTGVPRS